MSSLPFLHPSSSLVSTIFCSLPLAFNLTFSPEDNAHVAQSRLILLDATLIFFLSLTMYSYIRFRKLRYLYVQPCHLSNAIAHHPLERSPPSGGAG
jgi:dolichyl-phosphate-mannose--protein O-mannosyl transferase